MKSRSVACSSSSKSSSCPTSTTMANLIAFKVGMPIVMMCNRLLRYLGADFRFLLKKPKEGVWVNQDDGDWKGCY